MRYKISIKGETPLLMHSLDTALDQFSEIALRIKAITSKKGSNQTAADVKEIRYLECLRSIWVDENDAPTIPARAFRAVIEQSARKLRQGPLVREGLFVQPDTEFVYDRQKLGEKAEEVAKNVQFTVPVTVQRAKVLRTRAQFPEWSASFVVETFEDIVSKEHLTEWLGIAGTRIGIGDWRPAKSGHHGRFQLVSIEALGDS